MTILGSCICICRHFLSIFCSGLFLLVLPRCYCQIWLVLRHTNANRTCRIKEKAFGYLSANMMPLRGLHWHAARAGGRCMLFVCMALEMHGCISRGQGCCSRHNLGVKISGLNAHVSWNKQEVLHLSRIGFTATRLCKSNGH